MTSKENIGECTYLVRYIIRHFNDVYFIKIVLNGFCYLKFPPTPPHCLHT